MNYSIIIPSYNSEATILDSLQALTQQQFEEPYEIIVVDSSSDATPELIRQQFPDVILIHLEQRTDSYTARNIGIETAQGDILCFIDSDCLADPDWLYKIAGKHQQHPTYVAVGGSVVNGNPENLIGWAGYFAEFREFFPFHPPQFMRNIPTCNISYKRWGFEKYGHFEDLHPASIRVKHPQQGDLIFNLKLSINGEKILFDPAISVAHINMTTISRFLIHQYRLGRITSIVLRHFPQLPGAAIASSRVLTALASPFLPFVKFIRTFRVTTGSKEYTRRFLLISPVLLSGLFMWGAGFLRGAFLPDKRPSSYKTLDRNGL